MKKAKQKLNIQGKVNPARWLVLPGMFFCLAFLAFCRNDTGRGELRKDFLEPPGQARPWVFWYWMNASVSKEGITADLEAMREAGLGGAYLMPIRGAQDPPQFEPPAVQLTPHWWELVLHALKEAERLGLNIGMHASDGFAVAGGPWITPEMSMQKVTWTDTILEGGRSLDLILKQPETLEGYYRDIAVYAFPAAAGSGDNSFRSIPEVSSSLPAMDPGFLCRPGNREVFRSRDSCWILYEFPRPFTCRNITIRTRGYNYAAHRLWVQCSDDGLVFRDLCRLAPPRHGWQEESAEVVHAIGPITAKYFRFAYGRSGFEPGAEDLEMAKWSPSLEITGIYLSACPKLHQYLGKSGALWRIGPPTTPEQIPDSLCIPLDRVVDLSGRVDAGGRLAWEAPPGDWVILRMGHTSTGKTNYTGGGGLGLECDKFNPEAARIQFENWFGEAARRAGPKLTERTLKIFHVDSWECGSQNWSPVFREEFMKRRGYDPLPYLPAMAGFPLGSPGASEKFLHDVRETIAELLVDHFYEPLAAEAQRLGCSFSAECVAPTMTGDGMLHYRSVDLPMGEFWLRSPTHDKPNDMLDAISGAHVYGKAIVQAEGFTQLRMAWDEHPGMLKAMMDRNFALGINRLVVHVFTHNPWMDRRPGMTLSNNGLFFQRDQVWWKPGRAWMEYATRCQSLLQKGRPVADVAVFTGEEIPRRAVLPDRLVVCLPGIFGDEVVKAEKIRLANRGVPQGEMPDGLRHSANMADPGDWCDPLRGYSYDSFNPDALFNLATVKRGRILLPGGTSYGLLILPGSRRMDPGGEVLSSKASQKILDLVKAGATVLMRDTIHNTSGLPLTAGMEGVPFGDDKGMKAYRHGKGRIILGPWTRDDFGELGLEPDLLAFEGPGKRAGNIAWTHRHYKGSDIYFISNQTGSERELTLSLRAAGKWPDLYDPLSGEITAAASWSSEDGRTLVPLKMEPNGSVFIVLERKTGRTGSEAGPNRPEPVPALQLQGAWEIRFDPLLGGPDTAVHTECLESWHLSDNPGIRHYSGTAAYRHTFNWEEPADTGSRYWLELSNVHDLAEVSLNGEDCGVAWTAPFRVEISHALVTGKNLLEIRVSNTWANRLIGDHSLSPEQRVSWTTADYRLQDKPLLEGGLTGKISILSQ